MGTSPVVLTPRQHEVITLLAEGRTIPQIAAQLHVTDNTVRSHVKFTRERCGVRTVTEAAVLLTQGACVVEDQRKTTGAGHDRQPPPLPERRIPRRPLPQSSPKPVTEPRSKLYLKAFDRWVASGFTDQQARDVMHAIHGRDGADNCGGDRMLAALLQLAAYATLVPTGRSS